MVPQRQDGHDAKRQIVADRRGMQTEKKQQQQAKKKDNAALVAAVEPASRAKTCTACCGVYRSEDTFRRHYTNGACEKKQQKAAGAKSLREERKPAAKLVKERRAAQREADVTSADRSDERQFEFDSSDDGCAISLSDHTGVVIVSKVLHERKLLATYVLPGYTITAVADNGTPVTDLRAQALMDLVALSSDARRITVTFAKPPCPMPMRGYARKRFCKETKFKMTETQRRFLTSFCDAHETTHSQPRSKTVFKAMQETFGDIALDADTQRPILMDETAIFNWLKTRWAAKKTAIVHVAAAAAMAAGAAGAAVPPRGGDESDDGE